MCGLVFAGGKSSMSMGDVGMFEQFLQCDTYRGEHSTGVASLFKPWGKEAHFRVAKAAVDGFDFVKTEYWDAVTRMREQTVLGGAATYATFPKVMFGHNRWATMGAVNAVNAHPFEVGHIILAHNGTLASGWRNNLEDGHKFEVDSHCVAHNVAKIGIAATLQRIRGAFTLIWFNKNEMTLNIVRNDERPFHLWETTIGDWFGCSEEKMGDWLLTRGKTPKTFKRHFECEVGVQYIFDVSNGCVLKEEVKHELPRFRYYHSTYQERTPTYGTGGYSNRSMLEEYDDESALDAWWNERINLHSSTRGVRGSQTQEKETQGPSEAQGLRSATSAFEEGLRESGFPYKTLDIVEFSMFEYKEYPKKPGYGYIKGELSPGGTEFIEVQVHDVREDQFEDGKLAGCRFVSGYEIHGVKTLIGRPQNDLTLYPLDKCIKLVVEEATDDQDFSFLDHLDDRDDVVEQSREMLSGERFSESEWKKSRHNVCAMCDNPIPFDEMEVATIENSYCFCGDCIDATSLRKASKRHEHTYEPEPIRVAKTGQGFTRETWNKRSEKYCTKCKFSLIFEDIPTLSIDQEDKVYCEACERHMEDSLTIVQKEVYCLPCQGYHSSNVMTGDMTHAEWTALGVSCAWKIKYKEKFAPSPKPTREILSIKKKVESQQTNWNYVCTACGQDFPGEMMSKEQEDLCSECYKRFHCSTATQTTRTTIGEELAEKVLWNGMRVTEVMWSKMNKCRHCVRLIPFTMADHVHHIGDAPVCPDCADEKGLV